MDDYEVVLESHSKPVMVKIIKSRMLHWVDHVSEMGVDKKYSTQRI
jgi:hypothetical protein